ncbi:M4 family metallopeptidase [Peribacillus kribbensis]|uniref:M4 family metallopeptidase n=1 Tax=Peribacillus kribbensis TaxID=356658 RepID=UPI00040E4ADC|nr:M4 family metallopeptidase [Peribacillus kribbensis]
MKKKVMAPLVLSASLAAGLLPFGNVLADQPEKAAEKPAYAQTSKGAVPLFVQEKQLEKRSGGNAADALNFLNEQKAAVGIKNPKASLKEKTSKKDDLGMTHVRFTQTKNGVPVEGSEVIVHYNKQNEVAAVNGYFNKEVEDSDLNTAPTVSSTSALATAMAAVNAPEKLQLEPATDLVIYSAPEKNTLAYKVNLNFLGDAPGNWFIYVDASTGKVLDAVNGLMHSDEVKSQTGVGTGVLGENRLLHISQVKQPNQGTTFQLADYAHNNLKGIITYDYPSNQIVSSKSASFKTDYDRAGVDAHHNSEAVYEYYLKEHNRNSLDDKGMAIISYVHYGTDYNNAFWNGKYMTYGDGDGKFMITLSAGLDVAAHEMTHGVTTNTANLQYRNQSGALNEAFSDIFGALIDDKNWEIGEEIMAPEAKAGGRESLRSLSDPGKYPVGDKYTAYGNGSGKYPSNMSEFYNLPLSLDNGGVHINSSIINHAAYLTAQEVGREKLGKIYYRALTQYLTPTSTFSDARKAVVQSAVDLYGEGSQEAKAASGGFDQVGIQ